MKTTWSDETNFKLSHWDATNPCTTIQTAFNQPGVPVCSASSFRVFGPYLSKGLVTGTVTVFVFNPKLDSILKLLLLM
jgi:hypothetical protein